MITCPYCREKIGPSDQTTCVSCKTPHHSDCWNENRGCTIFGCDKCPTDDAKISINSNDINRDVQIFHTVRNGIKEGPYSQNEISSQIERNYLKDSHLIWSQDMDNWEPVYKEKYRFQNAVSKEQSISKFKKTASDRLRFGRLMFLSCAFGVFIISVFFEALVQGTGGLIAYLLGGIIIALRVRDIGRSGWTALWLIVPCVGFFICLDCIFSPRDSHLPKNKI